MATKTVITRVGNRTVEIQVQLREGEEAAKKERRIRAGLEARPNDTRKPPVAANAKGKGRGRMASTGTSKGDGSSAKAPSREDPTGESACVVVSGSDESGEGLNT